MAPTGKTLTGKTSTIEINAPGTYTLYCNQTSGCNELPFVYIYKIPEGPSSNFRADVRPCTLSVNLRVLDPNPDHTYTWKWQDSLPYTGKTTVVHNYGVPGFHHIDLEVKDKSTLCASVSRLTLTLTAPVDVRVTTTDPPRKLYGPDDIKAYVAASGYMYGNLKYTWKGENFYVPGQSAGIGEDGIYSVEAVDPLTGCNDTAIVHVELRGWIPNIFTPNNDGVNDLFRFRTKKGMTLKVVDRWGRLVYQSEDVKGIISWDGRMEGNDCSDGVFMYVLSPVTFRSDVKAESGTITLLR